MRVATGRCPGTSPRRRTPTTCSGWRPGRSSWRERACRWRRSGGSSRPPAGSWLEPGSGWNYYIGLDVLKRMELRHLRYFVSVAEQGSFVHAARRLRVAQPALSKQIRDLEGELGVQLFERLPRGVHLTRAGEAFLAHARMTLEAAARAVASARDAAKDGGSALEFAHGELAVYTPMIEDLLAAFRDAHPGARVRVSSMSDADAHGALRQQQIDVAAVFVAEWPVAGFDGVRLVDCATKGVLLPASHPLATKPELRLAELRDLTWLHSSPQRWPGFFGTLEDALRNRGLVPVRRRERAALAPTANVQIA